MRFNYGDVSSAVEPRVVIPVVMGSIPIRHPSFLLVRSSVGRALSRHGRGRGFESRRTNHFPAPVAQLVEHALGKGEASSSILLGGTSLGSQDGRNVHFIRGCEEVSGAGWADNALNPCGS